VEYPTKVTAHVLNAAIVTLTVRKVAIEVKQFIIGNHAYENFSLERQDLQHIKFSANSIEIQFL